MFERIINHFNINDVIQDTNHTYLGERNTTLRGVQYRSIKYSNGKCITIDLINQTYQYYLENNNTFPARQWYVQYFIFENRTRGCNITIAKRLIEIILLLEN